MRELISNPDLCIDCMKCERNCPSNAIRVVDTVPLFCMHCTPDKAPCLNICPENAIEALGGAITINKDKCIGCGMCRDKCPIGAISMDEIGLAKKCDLCINENTQLCAESCPTNALSTSSREIVTEKQDKLVEGLKKFKIL
ncbi:4Fe-4S dicluster domain-containing protein [Methanobrevibacter filiformis]|uniref:Iron-sulfur protein n=1 Tax=Methanobrevibacter filiformis TaxID=55758 RepID=A0A165Z118_9EURY|nr:4Fe-4S binding protein [Methanobrevibacter filiformis]KZX10112.1 iron-sulfur protein [Methanobrevibacter filiformis]